MSTDAQPLTRLLAATAAGDQRAFAELYAAASSHLFGLLMRILRRRDWAEEALQDCFLKVWQKAETYAPEKGAPLTWLLTIARYRALDLLRAKRPEVNEADDEAMTGAIESAVAEGATPLEGAETLQGLGRLEQCMKGLQQEQRQSVLLSYYQGYTHQELARRMKAPLGTVKSWVRRGLQQLRECLGPE